jgi:hypothetical protein
MMALLLSRRPVTSVAAPFYWRLLSGAPTVSRSGVAVFYIPASCSFSSVIYIIPADGTD